MIRFNGIVCYFWDVYSYCIFFITIGFEKEGYEWEVCIYKEVRGRCIMVLGKLDKDVICLKWSNLLGSSSI